MNHPVCYVCPNTEHFYLIIFFKTPVPLFTSIFFNPLVTYDVLEVLNVQMNEIFIL